MAGTSLLALLDDMTTLLDDIAAISKVAAKKTASVLGDDLAVNAQQLTGITADRELAVVWTVAKGSFKNKLILVPSALLISAFAPWLIIPLLICGGLFLCFEGFEKVWHFLFHKDESEKDALIEAANSDEVDLVDYEQDKIKGAIRTDLILSAEIIVITLGAASAASLATQVGVLSLVAIVITVGVYGLVAGIVKLDDAGLYLSQSAGDSGWAKSKRHFGLGLVALAPYLMRFLSVFGTLAMFMVGGGILTHDIGFLHHLSESFVGFFVQSQGFAATMLAVLFDMIVGMIAGAIILVIVNLFTKVLSDKKEKS